MSAVPLRKNRDFILLQAGQTLSAIGTESTGIAYPLLVLAVTHSPAKAGVVGFARIAPWPLFGFLAGVLADRAPRKRVMIAADVVRVALLTSIVVALALGRLTFAQTALVAFLEGTAFVLFNVSEFGALRSVVPASQLPRAAAGEQVRYSTVGLVAPPLGGTLFGLGRMLPFVAGALTPAFSLGSLLAIRTPFQEEREPDATPLRAQFTEGFQWLWSQPFLRACALLFSGTNVVFEAVLLIVIVVGRRQGLSPATIGALVAVLGACSLLGSAIAPRIQRRLSLRTIVIGSFWMQLGIAAFVADPSVYVLLAGVVPMFVFLPSVNATVIGYRVAVVPDRLTGRVNSIARTIALSGAPLGPLAAGVMLASLSARSTVAVLAVLLLALALVASASPSIRAAPSLTELEASPAVGG